MKLRENMEIKLTTPMKSQLELFIIKLLPKELPVCEWSSLTSWTLSPTFDKVSCEERLFFSISSQYMESWRLKS